MWVSSLFSLPFNYLLHNLLAQSFVASRSANGFELSVILLSSQRFSADQLYTNHSYILFQEEHPMKWVTWKVRFSTVLITAAENTNTNVTSGNIKNTNAATKATSSARFVVKRIRKKDHWKRTWVWSIKYCVVSGKLNVVRLMVPSVFVICVNADSDFYV